MWSQHALTRTILQASEDGQAESAPILEPSCTPSEEQPQADAIGGQCLPPTGVGDLQQAAVQLEVADAAPEQQPAAAVTKQAVLTASDKHEIGHWPEACDAAECAICWDAEASIIFQPCGQEAHMLRLCCSLFRVCYAMCSVQIAGHIRHSNSLIDLWHSIDLPDYGVSACPASHTNS